MHTLFAEFELLQGQARAARDRLEPLLKYSKSIERAASPLLPTLAWAEFELGEVQRSSTLLSEATELGEGRSYRLALVETLAVQARLAMVQSQHAEAESFLEQALALARRIPLPYMEAKLLYIYGMLDSATGDPQAAGRHLARALDICATLGERLYAERIEQEQARLESA